MTIVSTTRSGERLGSAAATSSTVWSVVAAMSGVFLWVSGGALVGLEVRVVAARLLGRGLGVVLQRCDELRDPRVGRVVDEQLVAPGLQRDRLLQPGVRREREAVLPLDIALQLGELGPLDLVRVVGDPHGAVLEHVDSVLIGDLGGVDRAGAVRPQ